MASHPELFIPKNHNIKNAQTAYLLGTLAFG